MNVVVCQSPVLRVATGMNDPIHVQVEVVKFHTIWIRETSINRQSFAVHHILLQKVQKRRIIMSNVPRWMHVVCVRLLPASAYVSPRQQAGKHEDIACIPPPPTPPPSGNEGGAYKLLLVGGQIPCQK